MSEQVGPEVTNSEPDGAEKAYRAPGVADFEEQRKTEWERLRLALGASDGDWKTQLGLGTAEFWERRQAEIEKYAAGYADLAARWETYRGWYLWQADKPEAIEVPRECQRTFDALARKALTGVPQLAALEGEPWQLWLEFMKYCHWPFEVMTIIPGSIQREWDSAVKDGITVWNYRDVVKYPRDDPDKWQYGLLLKRVFHASVLFCLELSASTGENARVFASARANLKEGNRGGSSGQGTRESTKGSEDRSGAGAGGTMAVDEKVNEILRPSYAQIQDRNGRFPAMRACHTDRDRAALADGMLSQANNWAAEALRAILECKDIIPPELASGSDLINQIIIRLTRDAAEFYSISTEDTAKSLVGDAKFPDHRSEIREQLQGFLAKFTESYWGENQKRHLAVPPQPPSVVKADGYGDRVRTESPVGEAEFTIENQEALTEAQRQTGWSTESDSSATARFWESLGSLEKTPESDRLNHAAHLSDKAVGDAKKLFESLDDFPHVVMEMRRQLGKSEVDLPPAAGGFGSKARLQFFVLERFDIRARWFLELVSDIDTQNAFITMLEIVKCAAWLEQTGGPIERLRPKSEQAFADLETIQKKVREWTDRGYERLAEAIRRDAHPANGVDSKVVTPGASTLPPVPSPTENASPDEDAHVGTQTVRSDKRNLNFLRAGGKLKRVVTLDVARRYGGVGKRAIEKAANKGAIETEGKGPNRRILVDSLVKYFPPENNTN